MYLAIDLEACNKYVKGSVFSIGVVGADKDFNVLFKRDILVNPHCKFCTNFRKPIEFSVNKEELKDAPDLKDVYNELKEMFSGDVIIMAHSANNDMFMLNQALKRAKLPPLHFNYICTQMIYSAVFDVMNGVGLDKAAKDMNIDFVHHKADEDAEMCLYILRECLKKTECTYAELEKKLGIKRGVVDNYEFTHMQCAKLDKLRRMHRQENKKEQQKLKKESTKLNGVVIGVDCKSFDTLRQENAENKTIFAIKDKFVSLVKSGDVIYVKKAKGHQEVVKVKVEAVKPYDSFVDVFYGESDHVKSDCLLSFLEETYEFFDYKEEEDHGVMRLTVSKVNA